MALNVDLKVDGVVSQVCLSDTDITITRKAKEEETRSVIAVDDIIAVDDNKSSSVDVGDSACCFSCVVHFITRNNDPKWAAESLTLSGTDDDINGFKTFFTNLNLKFNNIAAIRPKRLLVLMNAIAGKRQAQTVYDTVMTPLFQLAKITCDLVVSQRSKHLIEVMTDYDCKDVDGIVMIGGDGTVSEIINVLIKKAQKEAGIDYNDPKAELKPLLKPIGIIPTGIPNDWQEIPNFVELPNYSGTGNTTAQSLFGCQDVCTATLHVVKGKTKSAGIMGSYCENKLIGYCGCTFCLLYMAKMIHVADRQMRWMRTARYLAAMFLLLIRKIHVAPVEVTVYSREKQTRINTREEEIMVEKEETFRQDCCMVMIWRWPVTDKSNKFCYNPSDNENKEDFFAYFYERFGKFEILRHIRQFINQEDNIFDRPKIKEVKGYALRIKFLERGYKPPESDPRNLMVCIDGEIEDCPKADYYVKTIAHVIDAYCSR